MFRYITEKSSYQRIQEITFCAAITRTFIYSILYCIHSDYPTVSFFFLLSMISTKMFAMKVGEEKFQFPKARLFIEMHFNLIQKTCKSKTSLTEYRICGEESNNSLRFLQILLSIPNKRRISRTTPCLYITEREDHQKHKFIVLSSHLFFSNSVPKWRNFKNIGTSRNRAISER